MHRRSFLGGLAALLPAPFARRGKSALRPGCLATYPCRLGLGGGPLDCTATVRVLEADAEHVVFRLLSIHSPRSGLHRFGRDGEGALPTRWPRACAVKAGLTPWPVPEGAA